MYAGRDFDPIEPGETDVFTFEVTGDLANGATIPANQLTWSCAVVRNDPGATIDVSPASRLQGAATVTTGINPTTGALRTFLNQKVAGVVDGNVYRLEAVAVTSDGRTLATHSHVRCKAAS